MELQYNNAAGRLLAIFQEALKHPDNESIADVWANVLSMHIEDPGLKISPRNTPEIYRQLASLSDALSEVEQMTAHRYPNDLHLLHRDFPVLRRGLAPMNLAAQWPEAKNRFTEPGLMALELCARQLPREESLEQDELKAILTSIHQLRSAVRESTELTVTIKDWLLRVLSAVERAVELYGLQGGRKVKEALAVLSGEMVANPVGKEAIKNHAWLDSQVCSLANLLLTATGKVKQAEYLIEYSGQATELFGLAATTLTRFISG